MNFKDIPPLDNQSFSKLVGEIKDEHAMIGQKLMNHIIDCEDCRQKSIDLNIQAMKHIKDLEELQ